MMSRGGVLCQLIAVACLCLPARCCERRTANLDNCQEYACSRRQDSFIQFNTSSCSQISPASCERLWCKKTCRLSIIETIPDNVTFDDTDLPKSTLSAWKTLLRLAKTEIDIAAYKSSLRGKHVLRGSTHDDTVPGDEIYASLVTAAKQHAIKIRMVENYPPKDPGDNEDGRSLEDNGILERRILNFRQLFGRGAMHSKFLVVDQQHFYLGSANLDWRSLSQKMELGVLLLNCPCLATDLKQIFNSYWRISNLHHSSLSGGTRINSKPVQITRNNPLAIRYKESDALIYLTASPRQLNAVNRAWDLDVIVDTISRARSYVYIHVMDYIPMLVYQNPQRFWPEIDNALRRVALEHGVKVKMLVAALHFPEKMLHFMKSLIDINEIVQGSIAIKIFKVPAVTPMQQFIARDRRTHNKFLVTDDTAVIGTSNWSGDYFYSSTGIALVVHQEQRPRSFVEDMKSIFIRDWTSPYAHHLDLYMQQCLTKHTSSICETKKAFM